MHASMRALVRWCEAYACMSAYPEESSGYADMHAYASHQRTEARMEACRLQGLVIAT